MDCHIGTYNGIKKEIDALKTRVQSVSELESQKGLILAKSDDYVQFLSSVTRTSMEQVRTHILELSKDHEFFEMMQISLEKLADATQEGIRTGEIRVHSYSLYVIVRLLKPDLIVETGVANGKSSAFILRAIDMNKIGALFSIDKPEFESNPASISQGEALIPENLQAGWMVPNTLRSLWTLRLGDAVDLLPTLQSELREIDIFFHDSLHTYEHMKFELDLAHQWVKSNGVVLCDDIQYSDAFFDATAQYDQASLAFGTLGVILNSHKK